MHTTNLINTQLHLHTPRIEVLTSSVKNERKYKNILVHQIVNLKLHFQRLTSEFPNIVG